MRGVIVATAGVLGATLGLGACSGTAPAPSVTGQGERAEVALTGARAADDVVAATWRTGFAALNAGEDPAAVVVSPASLVVALSMLAEGATGESADALDAALGAGGDARTDAVNALTAELARYDGDPAAVADDELPDAPMVHLANQVVIDDGSTAQQTYLDRLMVGYGAGVLVTDLGSETGKQALDAWVRENSGGLIEESAIEPAPELELVLQNAVALAAAWQTPFDPDLTSPQQFTLADTTQVDVPMMRASAWFGYVEQDGWRAVRLPYRDSADGEPSALYADVILPPEGSEQAADPASADPRQIATLVAALDEQENVNVQLVLPSLDLTTSLDLLPVLTDLGLGGLLAPQSAHLDGILVDPPMPPYVGQAVQQSVLQVDEDGTRAAAVTEIGVVGAAAPAQDPIEMTVDRPYLFVITDGHSGWPLFLASVLDPRG